MDCYGSPCFVRGIVSIHLEECSSDVMKSMVLDSAVNGVVFLIYV